MLVKATREFLDDVGRVRSGQVLDLTDWHARQLIARGLATDVQGEAATHGVRSPISSAPSCPIGAAQPASSSLPDQAPASAPASSQDLIEKASSGEALVTGIDGGAESSPSTEESSSSRWPRLRMPATRHGGRRKRG